MPRPLKQSTAVTVIIGPFIDDTDGKTLETALTVTSMTADLFKDDATEVSLTITASGGSNDCAHVAQGQYSLELTATDTNTLGYLRLMVAISGALPVWEDFMVMPANVYDSLYGSDNLEVDAVQISGDTTAADNAELAFDGTGYGFTGCTMPTVTTLTGHTAQTGDNYARLGAPAGASIAADIAENQTDLNTALGYIDTEIAAILADTGELQTDWANGGRLDLLIDAIKAVTDNIPDSGSMNDLAAILADTGTDGVVVAAASKTGYALSAAGIDAIWDDTEGVTGDAHSYETILSRLYMFFFHEMNITDATGAVQVRNTGDTGNVLTHTITDDDTTTDRTKTVFV